MIDESTSQLCFDLSDINWYTPGSPTTFSYFILATAISIFRFKNMVLSVKGWCFGS